MGGVGVGATSAAPAPLREWRYVAISLGAPVGVRGDTPTLKAIEPPPSAPHTPRRYAGGRREARPTHPSLAADGRHPPRERRAGTPSRGGAILGSLCSKSRQMAYLSSSLHSQRKIFSFSCNQKALYLFYSYFEFYLKIT